MKTDIRHRIEILSELSESYLAYLLDDNGYYVEVFDNSLRQNTKSNLIKDGFRIELAKRSSDSAGLTWIQWDDVKDRVIPLVYELSKDNSVIVHLGNVFIPLQNILYDDNVNELRLQDDFAQPEGFLILKLYIV
jgi:hypothetical protein